MTSWKEFFSGYIGGLLSSFLQTRPGVNHLVLLWGCSQILCCDPRRHNLLPCLWDQIKTTPNFGFHFSVKGIRFSHFWSLFFIYYCYLGCYRRLWKLNKYDPSCHSVLGTISDSPHERCYWVPLMGGGRLGISCPSAQTLVFPIATLMELLLPSLPCGH